MSDLRDMKGLGSFPRCSLYSIRSAHPHKGLPLAKRISLYKSVFYHDSVSIKAGLNLFEDKVFDSYRESQSAESV